MEIISLWICQKIRHQRVCINLGSLSGNTLTKKNFCHYSVNKSFNFANNSEYIIKPLVDNK